jgi:hypothetical protein
MAGHLVRLASPPYVHTLCAWHRANCVDDGSILAWLAVFQVSPVPLTLELLLSVL